MLLLTPVACPPASSGCVAWLQLIWIVIITENFLWLHLPKSGGTSMAQLFRNCTLPGVGVDSDTTALKHDSVVLRERRGSWRAGQRRRFITSRRLESWLISDWQHKRRHMNMPDLDFESVRSGLFYSLRLGGLWVAADWWLHYFEIDEQVTALRLEHLHDDLQHLLWPLLPAGTPHLQRVPHENAAPPHVRAAHLHSDGSTAHRCRQPTLARLGAVTLQTGGIRKERSPSGRDYALCSRHQTIQDRSHPRAGDAITSIVPPAGQPRWKVRRSWPARAS